jgi:DsbC/DsbD-like thiol-disulfide interchange protein/cytochrome c biogenesis protein CcdA
LTVLFRCLFLSLFAASAALAAPVKTEHVEAELVAERSAAKPGEKLTVALRLKIVPEWHTYWRNPGDSGEPTALEWKLPAGWSAGEIQWPAPRRLPAGPLLNFGYENEVLHLVDIAVPAAASGAVTLRARATWLVCNPVHCIPEEGELSLDLPVGAGEPTAWADAIARSRAALPAKAQGMQFAATRSESGVSLQIDPPPTAVVYFPFEQGKIHNAGVQRLEGGVLAIPKALQPVGAFTRVSGLLVTDRQALEIDVPVQGAALQGSVSSLALAVLFAFAGGLILNLMPCVLPVLSIKILGLAGGTAGHAAGRRAMRAHGLLYGLGVVLSFLLFAGVLIALQALGSGVGWGFQLQSPVFVGLLALLFIVLALNLWGVFEFSAVLPSSIAGLQARNKQLDAFLTGVLAVAVASPCTAPFMGAALGYALTGGALEAVAVFAALGIGMALPYVALAWNPRWLAWLPKPGPWMLTFKRVLAVPLFATVIWLGWVLGLQSGLLTAASDWEKFSPQALQKYSQAGKSVFVDYTAAWCVTCQVNKQLVLQQPEVEKALQDSGMALLRADWTRRDPEITQALAELGRKGVPVYAIYRPGSEPQLLPEILTRDTVLAALGTSKETSR